MDTGAFGAQHIQQVTSPATRDDERETSKHHLHFRINTVRSSHADPSFSSLKKEGQTRIIELILVGTSTTWCSRKVVVPKENRSPRHMVDLQKVNVITMRETHPTPSPFFIKVQMKENIRDVCNVYHSLPLSPAAQDTTTFITEWGRS